MTMMIDLRRSLESIGEKIKSGINNKDQSLSMSAVVEIKKDVCKFVTFHGDAKE